MPYKAVACDCLPVAFCIADHRIGIVETENAFFWFCMVSFHAVDAYKGRKLIADKSMEHGRGVTDFPHINGCTDEEIIGENIFEMLCL